MNVRNKDGAGRGRDKEAHDSTLTACLGSLIFLLLVVCAVQKNQMSNLGYESKEHMEMQAVCAAEKQHHCEVKFGPYIQYRMKSPEPAGE